MTEEDTGIGVSRTWRTVAGIDDIQHARAANGPDIVRLAAGRRVKRRAIENGLERTRRPRRTTGHERRIRGAAGLCNRDGVVMDLRCRSADAGRLRQRHGKVKQRAAQRAAAIADFTAERMNDAVAHGQPQAGALTHRLGREKRLEEFRFVLGRDALTRVFHFEMHEIVLAVRAGR